MGRTGWKPAGDYNRTGTGISSLGSANAVYYNGVIPGQSWKSLKPGPVVAAYGAGVNDPAMVTYEYDNKYQFNNNKYGAPNFVSNSFTEVPNVNREHSLSYDANGNIKTLNRTNASGAISADFSYTYQNNTNKLASVSNYATYGYDDLGQMTQQNRANGQGYYLKYNANGKVDGMYSDAGFTQLRVSYAYDEAGHRIRKTDHLQNITTYYVYGGADELIALYDDNGTILQQKELPLYGSGRIGTYSRVSNSYQYELTDHLGNVQLVINQDKVNGAADVVYYSDYYPFGSPLTLANNDYRYGYQGQYAEVDKETGWNNFDFRMYDAQIGRWMSTDPAGQFHSPYVGMGNNPVIGVDPDGRFVGTLLGALIGGGIKAIQGGSWNEIGKAALAGAAGAMGGMAQEFTNQQLNHGNNPRAIVEAGMWGMAGGALGVIMPNVGRVIKGFSANIGIGKATSTVISETGESLGSNGLIGADIAEGGTTALRKVGSVLESVDDVMANPNLLQGQSYGYVRNMLGKSEGWINSVMTKTRGADKGWVLRQVNSRGQETGRLIQYHPGSRRHFGGALLEGV